MAEQTEKPDDGYEVVFTQKWTDTTRHGYMRDYPASDKPVRLSRRVADAAVASGRATVWRPDDSPSDDRAAD